MYARNEKIIPVYIEEEMQDSYINYAMSVIVGRALPDVRDGLKPVHRRILYAMKELGVEHNKPYKKSARIVGDCFVKDTLVASSKGLIAIQDIERGDSVYTQKGLKKVTALFEMPAKNLLKVVLENGIHNTVTPSQKMKVLNDKLEFVWKEARDITRGDYAIMKSAYPDTHDKALLGRYLGQRAVYLNENIAYLLGLFLSDGWVEKRSGRLCFYSVTEEIIHRIHKILKEEFDYEARVEIKKYKYITENGVVKNTGYQIRVHRTSVNGFLTDALCLNGMRSLTKKIPAQIFSSPSAVVWAFVSGLVDGDGSIHVNRNVVHYGSISEELINQLQILLQHQNVLAFRYSEGPRDGHVFNGRFVRSDNKSYSLEFRGVYAHLMASSLSLASREKAAKIMTMLTKDQRDCWSSLDAIPYAGKAVFQELSEAHLGGGWYKNGEGKKFRAGIKYQSGSKIRYSIDLWDKPLSASQVVGWGIMDKLRQIESPLFSFIDEVIKERLHFVRVDFVEDSPAEKTYDIQVEDDHEFIANGMLSHNCMGKYHPHGDSAIYDTLVRMAQDFSLRYTLVEGQGNFGCFTIDTKVKLADGRSLSFGELIGEDIKGKKNYTFTFNDKTGKIESAQIRRPRLTKKNVPVMKITLDNNEEIKCTLNHKFMLRDGTYKEAQGLVPGVSLMPLYTRLSLRKDDPNAIGAEFLYKREHKQPVLNHKVLKVEFLEKREDVYDLTINTTHNFALAAGVFVHNSVDGDTAASMRYTEARLDRITDWMLLDIDKNTVDFMPNFDGSLKEPTVLPACLPNLLVNGSSGIAVGMATNIPPHNLKEIAGAVAFVIDNPCCDSKDLLKSVKGPDFPTGGIIRGTEGIRSAYTTGRGLLKVHAKAFIEEQKNGKEAIIIKELPYQVNKANLIESIADLVTDKKIDGITDLRDESDKDGMRVVIEVRRGANSKVILNQLYKHTQMQTTFGVIMLALVDGRPRVLNLKNILEEFIRHRKEVITRRTKYDLEKAQDRAHILEGLKIALKELDRVIKIIRSSKDPQEAKAGLMEKIGLSDRQAQAILEMQLQRLTHLERDKIDKEYLELIKKIELFKSILESEKKVLEIIKEDMKELSEKFGDERRTEILPETEELDIEDLIAEEDVVITISHAGYIKRLPVSGYRRQRRGGKGVTGADMKEDDFIEHLFVASTHDYMLFFTDKGTVHWLKVHEIPEAGRTSKGRPIINLLTLGAGEKVSAFVPVRHFKEGEFLVMATKNGLIKKTSLTAYSHPRKGGIIGITLEKDDELIGVQHADGDAELLLGTREGKAIRFKESQVRNMGRGARGVHGIRLGKKDALIAMEIAKQDQTVLTVTQEGFGKRTSFKEYRLQSRGGKGIINIKVTGKNGEAVGMKTVSDKDEIMLITEKGMIVRSPIKDIRATGRSTQGVRLMKLDKGDKIASIAKIIPEDEAAEEEKLQEAKLKVDKEAPAGKKEEAPVKVEKPKEEPEAEAPKEGPKKKATKRKK